MWGADVLVALLCVIITAQLVVVSHVLWLIGMTACHLTVLLALLLLPIANNDMKTFLLGCPFVLAAANNYMITRVWADYAKQFYRLGFNIFND